MYIRCITVVLVVVQRKMFDTCRDIIALNALEYKARPLLT